MIELPKYYDASGVEDKIYQMWLDSGYFNPDNLPDVPPKEPYTIILPPLNVTGNLHMGHAYEDSIQDILIRFKRMQGFKTLWLPGTDHAAIATQSKVEAGIYKKEEKTRHDLGRAEFLKRVGEFAKDSHDTIVGQLKKMGASCDWSREAYTLDDTRNRAVKVAFKRLHELGLVYRGNRMVNWDPKLQTVVSDDEIEWKDEITQFYYLKYGPFTIGTARPETKFGDKYVVMHPEDARFAEWKHGQKLELEWINGPVTATVIKDEAIDMEFGTGVMTITPWHDAVDFEIAQRHGLDIEQIIDERGLLLPIAKEFTGQHIKKARPFIVEKLQAKGLVEKIEYDYSHRLATNSRGNGVIEPQIKEQWFVDVNREFALPHSEIAGIESGDVVTLKRLMRHVVETGQVKIIPDHFGKIYFHWVDNLRDWCISRQIWFGHRVPVWYDAEGKQCLPKELDFILARHAECEDNAQDIMARPESSLTELGRDQSASLARALSDRNITKIIASPLIRSLDTAKIVLRELSLPESALEVWEELSEIYVGDLVGQKEKQEMHGFAEALKLGTGESLESLESRVKSLIARLEKLEISGGVLLVGHGGVNAIIEAVILGRCKEDFVHFRTVRGEVPNGSFQKLILAVDPQGGHLTQDEDTFDTWFSSGLWTFTTLGWPNESRDLKEYHPTSVINPGYEILQLWIARMILMSTALTGQVPFHTAFIHGLVRDKLGRKFSKSLNNGVDPLDMINKYGTDALRMALVFTAASGNDVAFDEDKIKGMKHFANKLWNIARFIITNISDKKVGNRNQKSDQAEYSHLWGRPETITGADREILNKLDAVVAVATDHLENFRLHEAAQSIYQFTWHELADMYIEVAKNQLADEKIKESTEKMLYHCLITILKLLHPFMPFITEHISNLMIERNLRMTKDPLIISEWPKIL